MSVYSPKAAKIVRSVTNALRRKFATGAIRDFMRGKLVVIEWNTSSVADTLSALASATAKFPNEHGFSGISLKYDEASDLVKCEFKFYN